MNRNEALTREAFNKISYKFFWADTNNIKNKLYDDMKENDGKVYLSSIERKLTQSNRNKAAPAPQ